MKVLAIALCSMHFVAVLMTSGLAMCAGADGHASYEWRAADCCCAAERDACAGETGPAIGAAPDCGGCEDGLAPLPGGVQQEIEAVIPAPVETGTAELIVMSAAGEPVACGTAVAGPRVSLPLRC